MNDSHQKPEQQARQQVDRLLTQAGWVVQDRADFNRNAAVGVAVREFPLPLGYCDYLLFVDGKAAGVIEAKKAGVTLSGVADQSARYQVDPPPHLACWDEFLVYDYESTGDETFFSNRRDPKPRSRRLFAFHRPETLHDWLRQPATLRAKLRELPPLDTRGLRDCQITADGSLYLCGQRAHVRPGYWTTQTKQVQVYQRGLCGSRRRAKRSLRRP